jgi:transcriptional regulator with XRE-family HTH domain
VSGHKNFSELRDRVVADPERRARIEKASREYDAVLALADLRESLGVTQTQLANLLEVSQPNVSKLEHKGDVYLSTLSNYVAALGGRLELKAVFPGQSFDLALPKGVAEEVERQQKAKQQASKVAGKFAEAVMESYQAVAERAVSSQQLNAELTQNFFNAVINNLRSQAESTRTTQELQDQREATQTLTQESVGAYMDFVNSMFAYYQGTVEQAGRQPLREIHSKR